MLVDAVEVVAIAVRHIVVPAGKAEDRYRLKASLATSARYLAMSRPKPGR